MDAAVRDEVVAFLLGVVEACPGNNGDCPNSPCFASSARQLLTRLGEEAPPEPDDDDEEDDEDDPEDCTCCVHYDHDPEDDPRDCRRCENCRAGEDDYE